MKYLAALGWSFLALHCTGNTPEIPLPSLQEAYASEVPACRSLTDCAWGFRCDQGRCVEAECHDGHGAGVRALPERACPQGRVCGYEDGAARGQGVGECEAARVETPAPATEPTATTVTEGDESLVGIAGSWRVAEHLRSGVSAMSEAQASRLHGREVELVGSLRTPWQTCARATYAHRAVPVQGFLTESLLPALPAERASALGLAEGTVNEWTATCEGGRGTVMFHETAAGRVLLGHDGVWLVLERRPAGR